MPNDRRGDVPRWRPAVRITAVALASLVPLPVVLVYSHAATARERHEAAGADAEPVGQAVAAIVDGCARRVAERSWLPASESRDGPPTLPGAAMLPR